MKRHNNCRASITKEEASSTNMKKIMGRAVGGAILTLFVAFGVFTATSSTAQAQSPYYGQDGQYRRDRDGDWRRNRERNRRYRRDRRNDRNDRYDRNDNYDYGNNGRYSRNRGYGDYNNTNQIELNRGYRQGLETGASDGQRGQSYSPERSRHYKNASSQAFLNGFVRGYDEGYRQYSSNGGYRRGNSGIGGILGGIFGRP
jgi:hypothetical protein